MSKLKKCWLVVCAFLVQLPVMAQSLPFADEMVDTASDQTVFEYFEELVGDGFSLVFLAIGGLAFIYVMYGIIMKVIDWRKERIEVGELMSSAGVQIGILVVVFMLLGFAKDAIA